MTNAALPSPERHPFIASSSPAGQMAEILLVTDRLQADDLSPILEQIGTLRVLRVPPVGQLKSTSAHCVVVDIDLASSTPGQESQFLRNLPTRSSLPLIFVVDREALSADLTHCLRRAKALGATHFFSRSASPSAIRRILSAVTGQNFERRRLKHDGVTGRGVAAAHGILRSVLEVVRSKKSFTYEQVQAQDGMIIEALRVEGIKPWLEAVRRHHSPTYRHSLLVTGFAVAFSQRLGMRLHDQRRISRAGLLHDVGKAFTPLAILDKPGKLTDDEMQEIKRHPVCGHDLLVQQGGFPPEILDCVRHHHELLDGSGYPDGLKGSEIADLVRITTIADIYSALIEERAYKAALPAGKALSIMEAMGGKLDPDLLREFRSVASDSQS